MKETKWKKPLRRAAIHYIEYKNMEHAADNGIYIGISYPQAYPSPSDEGGLFVKVAEPGAFTEKGLEQFAEAVDTMLSDWIERNEGKLKQKAKEFSRKR
jgi:hypothetical protein